MLIFQQIHLLFFVGRKKTKTDEVLTFDFDRYLQEESVKKRQMIDQLVERHGLSKREIMVEGYTILILDRSGGVIPEQKLAEYKAQYVVTEKIGISNNCFSIAADSVRAGVATGRIAAHSGTSDFAGWGNHCISYDELDDGSVLAFDLTASSNIDERQGKFHILVIKDLDLDSLLSKVGDLYGGDWFVIQMDD